jgi:hypothetical protein
VSLDFMRSGGDIVSQHYAFLITESEFDEIYGRIRGRGLAYWADPSQNHVAEINHNDGGRGVYFEDPNGHLLEIITRPYGSGSAEYDLLARSADDCTPKCVTGGSSALATVRRPTSWRTDESYLRALVWGPGDVAL